MSIRYSEPTIEHLEAAAAILWRCFAIGIVSLLFVWGVYAAGGDWLHTFHAGWIRLDRGEFDTFVLYALTSMKVVIVVLFLFPYLAIRHLLRGLA